MSGETQPAVVTDIDARGVARVMLSNPDRHNVFDDRLIAHLTETFGALGSDAAVRLVVLAAEGKSFSAGADLNWMRRMAGYSYDENLADAKALAGMVRTLDRLPKPTVALVQGPAYGGGVGLIAACDIVVAADHATFALTEVKLGIIPAAISPFVIGAMGVRNARRYMLTAERFDAAEALRVGLVHQVVPPRDLTETGERIVAAVLANGPRAVEEAKDLIFAVAGRPVDEALSAETAGRIARVRASEEGREGVAAFLDKRKPGWIEE